LSRAVYLVGSAALLAAGCSRLFFMPETGLRLTPDQLGLVYEERRVRSDDEILYGWLLPARGPSRASVVFFHGNAENISTHIGSVMWLPGAGFSVLLCDYRGFGLSSGRSDLATAHRDARAILLAAQRDRALDPQRLVVFGQSLGGSIALNAIASLRGEVDVRAAVIEAAPSNYRQIARDVLAGPWFTRWIRTPLGWLVPTQPDPRSALAALPELPVWLVHGAADQIVPTYHSEVLFAAAGPRAQLWIVPDTGHIEGFQTLSAQRAFAEFVSAAVER